LQIDAQTVLDYVRAYPILSKTRIKTRIERLFPYIQNFPIVKLSIDIIWAIHRRRSFYRPCLPQPSGSKSPTSFLSSSANQRRYPRHDTRADYRAHYREHIHVPPAAHQPSSGPSWIVSRAPDSNQDQVNSEAPFGYVDPEMKAYFRTVEDRLKEWQQDWGDAEAVEDIDSNKSTQTLFSLLHSSSAGSSQHRWFTLLCRQKDIFDCCSAGNIWKGARASD